MRYAWIGLALVALMITSVSAQIIPGRGFFLEVGGVSVGNVSTLNFVSGASCSKTNTVGNCTVSGSASGDVTASGTLTNDQLVLGNGTTSIKTFASGSGLLHAGVPPTWASVSLTNDVTGLLPNANLANSSITVSGTNPIFISGSPWTLGSSGGVSCPSCPVFGTTNPYVITVSAPTQGGLIGGGVGSVNNGTNVFFGSASNASPRMPIPGNGWARNLAVNTAATQTTGAWGVFSLGYGAGSAGAPVMTQAPLGVGIVSGSAAGVYSQPQLVRLGTSNQMALVGTAPTAGVASVVPTGWSAEFVMDDGGVMIGSYLSTAIGAAGTPTVVYNAPFDTKLATTVGAGSGVSPFAATLQNVCFTWNATQDASGSLVMTAYVNGSSTAITRTVAAGTGAGTDCDRTHTAAVAANQTVSIQFTNNATAGSQTILAWTGELLPSSGTPGLVGWGAIGAVASGSTNYYKPFTTVTNATEANVRVPLARAGTQTNFCVEKTVGATVGTTTATVFKNGSATGQLTMTLDSSTGPQCVTGSVAWASNDTLTLEIKNSVACTGGCPTLGGAVVDY